MQMGNDHMKLRAHILATCIAATLAVSFSTQAASPVDAVNLLEVYQRALQNDPVIREAEANRLATLENRPQARAQLLPSLTASAGYSQGDTDFTRGQFINEEDGDPLTEDPVLPITITTSGREIKTTQWSVSLRQTLFRWDRWIGLKRADKQVAQAEVEFKAAQQDLLARTAQRYFDVLAAEDTLEAAQATLEAFARQLEQADKRFEVGLIAITDVQEARAARDQGSAAVIAAKRSLATSREFLRELTGDTFGELAKPAAEMPLRDPRPANEDEWVTAALAQNLNLLSARLQTDIAKEDVRVARAGHLPTLDFVARKGRSEDEGGSEFAFSRGNTSPSIPEQEQESETIGVELNFPIFSGGATQSQVRQRVYLHRAARERSERTARETEREARDAYLGVLSEISRVQALRQAVQSSQTALQATEAGFEVGTRTTVDVLESRRNLFDAQTNYARSRYDYIINLLRLKIATGNLSEADLQEVNGFLTE
jgi:outer membrane protein